MQGRPRKCEARKNPTIKRLVEAKRYIERPQPAGEAADLRQG